MKLVLQTKLRISTLIYCGSGAAQSPDWLFNNNMLWPPKEGFVVPVLSLTPYASAQVATVPGA